jgi:hypothetical protein
MGSVPPACRGNLKEGVSTAVFCELWFGDWYNEPRAGRAGVGAMFKSHCKDTYYSGQPWNGSHGRLT